MSDQLEVNIVCLIGPAQAGKTTVANEMQTEHGFTRMRFADPLKRMLETFGVGRDHLDGGKKEQPLDILCGKTARYAMQKLGTEWHDMLDKRLWAVNLARSIASTVAASQGRAGVLNIVIDDMRFLHEVEVMESYFPGRIRIVKVWNSTVKQKTLQMWLARRKWGRAVLWLTGSKVHQSEAWWPIIPANAVIDNCGSLTELYQQVRCLMVDHTGTQQRRVRIAAE